MTEARLVTRALERLRHDFAALRSTAQELGEAGQVYAWDEAIKRVDEGIAFFAITDALPAAAPADDEAQREAYLRAYDEEQHAAAPAEGLRGGCYFCGGVGIGPHPGCPGGNTPYLPDADLEGWYAAFEKVSGLESTTLEGKRSIFDQFDAALARHESAGSEWYKKLPGESDYVDDGSGA